MSLKYEPGQAMGVGLTSIESGHTHYLCPNKVGHVITKPQTLNPKPA